MTWSLPSRRTWIALAVCAASAVGLAAIVVSDPTQFALFLGRFHTLVVHLPIGGLAVAATLAMVSRTARFAYMRIVLAPLLVFCTLSAVASVIAGQLLASGSGYAGATLDWHQRLGYGVALVTACATLAAAVERVWRSPRLSRFSDGLIGVSVLLLVITGHLGGTLTHGPGYLTEHMPHALRLLVPGVGGDRSPTGPANPQQIVAYTDVVAPILSERCISCHGPDRADGRLRLDMPEHIQAGGGSGAVVAAGQAAHSDLVRRVWLPVTHRDVMPPRGRAPLTVTEAALLRWWVDTGASYEATLADVDVPDELRPAIEARVGTLPLGELVVLSVDVPPLNASRLAELTRRRLPVSRLAEQDDLLQVQARGVGQAFGDAHVEALLPVAEQVTWLDLGGTAVTDDTLETLARFPHLTRLHLDRTSVTDAGLAHLQALEHLAYVNLYGTAVTDVGLETLAVLPRLRTLYLWQTAVTPEGIAALTAAQPGLTVNTGLPASSQPAASPPIY